MGLGTHGGMEEQEAVKDSFVINLWVICLMEGGRIVSQAIKKELVGNIGKKKKKM